VEEGEAVRWISEFCASRDVPVKIDPMAHGIGRRARRRHDDDLQRTGEADALRRREEPHHSRDVETMVLAAKQRSLYELTDAISAKDRCALSNAGCDALVGRRRRSGHRPHLHAAKTFRQMLVILERNVRDQRMLWRAMARFRVPPFAADDIIKQAAATNPPRPDPRNSPRKPKPISPCAPIP